jgi:hypothetical protein
LTPFRSVREIPLRGKMVQWRPPLSTILVTAADVIGLVVREFHLQTGTLNTPPFTGEASKCNTAPPIGIGT